MTQPAVRYDQVPALASLLEREFEPEALAQALGFEASIPAALWDTALRGPLQELASRPSKEFRGRLVAICWQIAGGRSEAPPELPAMIEALHLGSLIVDDIEDGSALRRGGPAMHQLVGLPRALNAGNWLYFLPTLFISRLGLTRSTELVLRQTMERAVLRCHYGQALDLSVRVTELRRREVAPVVAATTRLKTGSLTELAARIGALCAAGDERNIEALGHFGSEFGVALQMLDDLTGITCEKRCHKGHEDLLEARPSWAWAWLSELTDDVAYLRLRALAEGVSRRDVHPEIVAEQLREQIAEPGRLAIERKLRGAFQQLITDVGELPGTSLLREELSRLEAYGG